MPIKAFSSRLAAAIDETAHPAAIPQPAPQPGERDVLTEAVYALHVRSAVGVQTYGTRLKTENGRDALEDWYQEQCDAFMYATQFILEYRAKKGQE